MLLDFGKRLGCLFGEDADWRVAAADLAVQGIVDTGVTDIRLMVGST
jgi:hypothetical protein